MTDRMAELSALIAKGYGERRGRPVGRKNTPREERLEQRAAALRKTMMRRRRADLQRRLEMAWAARRRPRA